MADLVITGATSMLGVALIEEALLNGKSVLAIIRPNSKNAFRIPDSSMVEVIESEISELSRIDGITSEHGVFYHLAWKGSEKDDRDDPELQVHNIQYTLDAVDLAHRCGCRAFIGAGSQAEYGIVEERITAETKESPETAYGICKLAANRLSRILCQDYHMRHIWARIFSVYGIHDREDTMISYAVRSFLQHNTAFFSSGEQMWDYLFETDAACFLYRLGENCNRDQSICIASGQSKPIREYISVIANEMNAKDLCVFSDEEGGKARSIKVDISDLKRITGFEPRVSFKEGIKRITDYYYGRSTI